MLVGVDLLPATVGGANGGAKWLTLALIDGLATLDFDLVCFCRGNAAGELRKLLSLKIELVVVPNDSDIQIFATNWAAHNKRSFDALLFPFTSVTFQFPTAASISVLHDLQYLDLPHNFSPTDRMERHGAFLSAVRRADMIITVSNFVKSSLLSHSDYPASKIVPIYNSIADRLQEKEQNTNILPKLGLASEKYFLYPANFWEHKNHRGLLAAYMLYLQATGDLALPLVLTGAAVGPVYEEIRSAVNRLCKGRVKILGFVDQNDLQTLVQNSCAIIFPSLYEGFGIPLLEAMSFGRPLACGLDTCIPEIAGSGAVFFDSHKPRQIAEAMIKLANDSEFRAEAAQRSRKRGQEFGSTQSMVEHYAQVIRESVLMPRTYRDSANDVYGDGWIGREATFTVAAREDDITLTLELMVPDYIGANYIDLVIETSAGADSQITHQLRAGEDYALEMELPKAGGFVKILSNQTFQPSVTFGAADTRILSLICKAATISTPGRSTPLLGEKANGASQVAVHIPTPIIAFDQAANTRRVASICLPTGLPVSGLVLHVDITPPAFGEALSACVVSDQKKRTLKRNDTTENAKFTVGTLRPGENIIVDLDIAGDCRVESVTLVRNNAVIPTLNIQSKPISAPSPLVVTDEAVRGFSVVMPSYNQGRFIKRSIVSCLQQEGIVDFHLFDACSTDETDEICKAFADRIHYVREKDRGQSDAINKGIRHARGDVIAWLNSDDTYNDNAFRYVRKIFDENPNVGIVYGEAFHIDEFDKIIERYPSEDFNLARLIETCFFCQPATFIRRSVFEQIGLLREDLHYNMDYEFWLRAAFAGISFVKDSHFLANSRVYGDTKTLGARVNVHREVNDMMRTCFNTQSSKWMNAFAHYVLQDVDPANSLTDRPVVFERLQAFSQNYWDNRKRSLLGNDAKPAPSKKRTAQAPSKATPKRA